MIILALILSSVAAISGILAIGSGRHWNFDAIDYFRGKRNAVLYLWVTASTIFSICHAAAIAEFGLLNDWESTTSVTTKWFVIHAIVGALLICAHLFVASTLSREKGPVNKFLWGARRAGQ